MAFPQIVACIVCEGVRAEILNKHTLLGFFGVAPDLRVNVKDFRLPSTLMFVFCGGAGEGKFNLQLRVSDSSGAMLSNSAPYTIEGELFRGRPNTTVFFGFQGVLGKAGKFRVSLMVDNVEHYFTTVDIGPFEEN
jgi:hypothetical protein